MASTAPPVVVGFAAALGARLTGGRFYYHCMDIHPEIGRLSGEFRNPLVYRILHRIDRLSCRLAYRIIVLSGDMKQSLLVRSGLNPDAVVVLNNFSMPHHGDTPTVPPDLLKKKGMFRIVFAGNIGRFQGLEAFVDAMGALQHETAMELVFLGEGSALVDLKTRARGLDRVHFLPHQEVAVAREIIADADMGVVSLTPEIYKYAYPSKTMTYLAAGCPLLVSVEPESELVRFVEAHRVGVCVIPRSPEAVARGMAAVFHDAPRHADMQRRARELSRTSFSEDHVLTRWSALFQEASG